MRRARCFAPEPRAGELPRFRCEIRRQLLEDVLATLAEYRVVRTWVDGGEVLLEFEGKVGPLSLQGIDRISLGGDGKVVQLTVFIRPYKALVAMMISAAERRIQRMSFVRRIPARAWLAMRSRL